MSDWRPKQGAARFRGVPFFVESGERTGGRQTAIHEFPFSEEAAFTEDMGLKGREFTVEGYVLGTEYEAARDALLSALESDQGPGELVHPYFGTRRVSVITFRLSQKRAEGGLATFSIDFRETSAQVTNAPVVDAPAVVKAKVAAAKVAVSAQIVATHSKAPYTGDIEFSSAELTASQNVVALMGTILDSASVDPHLRAAFDLVLAGDPSGAFDFQSEVMAAVFVDLFDALALALASSTAPINPSALILGLYDFNPGNRPPASTPNRIIERTDFDSLQHLVQRLAIIYATDALIAQAFVSYDEAIQLRSQVTDAIDRHVEEVSDDTFPALIDLRSSLTEAVPGDASDLPRIQRYTPPAVVPSLVLAHRLYGSLDREEDLIRRNGVRNPGFVPADEIEILSDG